MSTTIDQKVVEMRFDNRNFENNVKDSLSTLDKLKQKLNLTGASKGLENVQAAANKVNLGGLGSAVQSVHAKFSALEVMGITALSNITNQAVNAGKRIVAAFTIDPVRTGFQEYELKMGSIQTIMAGTGESLETVNQYLNELNEYSDRTIYSFSDMTQNIGKFTNAGVKLEDAVLAIKGISNEAAVSGANANEASRAMYNFAQSLSSGFVKLIDWKSIENANMATVEFKNQLIQSALEMGTLEKGANDLYNVVEVMNGQAASSLNATHNFNDSLANQWMTSEVLINALKKYADETTDIGKKAYASAQDVKTFTMMMDTLKESAQSGWAQTWELLVGDFNQAKSLWTNLSKFFGDFIDKSADARNSVLKGALTSSWDKLTDTIQRAGFSVEDFEKAIVKSGKKNGKSLDTLIKRYGSLKKAIDAGKVSTKIISDALKDLLGTEKKVEKTTKELGDVVNKVINGDFGTGKERIDKLTEAGYNYAEVQNLVNEKLGSSVRHHVELSEAQIEQADNLVKLSDAQLKAKGYTEDQIKALRELEKAADDSGTSISELIANLDKPSGRELLLDSFKNLYKAIKKITDTIGEAWDSIFGDSLKIESSDIYNLIEKFNELTESLIISDEAAANLKNVFEGLFALFQLGNSIFSMSVLAIIKIGSAVLELFGTNLLEVAGYIGKCIVSFRDWVKENTIFIGHIDKIAEIIKVFIDGIRGLVKAFLELDVVKNVLADIKEFFVNLFDNFSLSFEGFDIESLIKNLEQAFDNIREWIKNLDTNESFEAGLHIVSGLIKGLTNGAINVGKTIVEIGKNLISKFCELLGIRSPSRVFIAIGGFIIAGLLLGLQNGTNGLFGKMIEIGKGLIESVCAAIPTGFSNIVNLFKSLTSKISTGMSSTFNSAGESIGGFIKGMFEKIGAIISKIDFGGLMAFALAAGTLLTVKKVADALLAISKPIAKVTKVFNSAAGLMDALKERIAGGSKFERFAKSMLSIATAIGILAGSIFLLASIPIPGLIKAVAVMALVIGAVALLIKLSSKVGDVSISVNLGKLALALLGISGSMLLMGLAMKAIGSVPAEKMGGVIAAFVAMAGGIALIIAAFGKCVNKKSAEFMHKAGSMLIKMSIAMLIMVLLIKIIDKLELGAIIKGIAVIAAIEFLFLQVVKTAKISGKYAAKAGGMMLAMSLAMLIMIGVIKLASQLELGEVVKGIIVVAALSLLFAGVVKLCKHTPKNVAKAGLMCLLLSLAMERAVKAVKAAGSMSPGEIAKGIVTVGLLAGLFAAMIKVTKGTNKHIMKAGVTMFLMAAALAIIVGILFVLKEMDPEGLGRAMSIVVGLELLFIGILQVSKKSKKVTGALVAISVAIGLLTIALIALSFIDEKDLKKSTSALGAVMLIFGGLIAVTKLSKNGKSMINTLLIMTIVVATLAGLIIALSYISPDSAMKNAAALAIVMVSFGAMLAIIGKSKSISKTALAAIDPMIRVIVVLAAVLAVFAVLNSLGMETTIETAASIGLLLNTFASSLLILSKIKTVSKSALAALQPMALVATELAGILVVFAVLNKFGMNSTVQTAASIGILLNAFASSLIILSKVGNVSPMALKALQPMALVATELAGILVVFAILNKFGINASIQSAIALGVLLNAFATSLVILDKVHRITNSALTALQPMALVAAELAFILGLMTFMNVQSAIPNAIGLGILINALAVSMVILSGVGYISNNALIAIAVLGLVMIELSFALGILSLMDVQSALPNALALSLLLVTMTGIAIILGATSGLITAAIPAVIGLGIVVAELALVLAALGGLAQIPGLEWLISEGGDLLQAIGTAIGQFIGGIVGGFAAGATSGLPEVGANLSMFMIALTPFLAGLKMIDETMLDKAGTLAKIIIAFTIADLINALASFISSGSSLATFGAELSMFMMNVMPFIMGIKMIDESILTGVKSLAEALLILTATDLLNSLTSWITGGSSLADFGSQLGGLGLSLNLFAQNLGTFDEKKSLTIKCAADAIKALAEAASSLPNSGGWLGAIVGENDISTFGASLPMLGTYMHLFAQNLGTFGEDQITTINCAAQAIKAISDVANELPNEGGWLAAIVGDNDILTFGAKLPMLGTYMHLFAQNLGTFGEDQVATINCAANAIKAISDVAQELPNEGGWLAAIVGDNDILTFGAKLPLLGSYIHLFAQNLGTFGEDQVATINCAAQAIASIAETAKNIPNEGGWLAGIVGDNDIGTFGDKLGALGTDIAEFAKNAGAVEVSTVSNAVSVLKALVSLSNTGIKESGSSMKTFGTNIHEFAKKLESFATKMGEISSESLNGAIDKIKSIKTLAQTVASSGNIQGLSTFNDSLIDIAKKGIKKFVEAFNDETSKKDVYNGAAALIKKFIEGLGSKDKDISSKGEAVAKKVVSAIKTKDMLASYTGAGKYVVDGFCKGINNNLESASAAGTALGNAARAAAEAALGVESPSKVFYGIGRYVVYGFTNALGDYGNKVYDAGSDMADNARSGMANAIGRVNDIINGRIDTQPTIRPVLDLSEVQSGVGAIDGLFNNGASIGLLGNVNAIGTMMNRRRQNGNNDDVVSAIDKLSRQLDNVGNTSYNIGDVSYDSDSNISNAVESLVNAIKVERRR